MILGAKKAHDLTFEAIVNKVGKHKVWTTSALLGQAQMTSEEADAVVSLLDLPPSATEHRLP